MPKRPASVITLEVDRNQRADGVPGKRVFQTAVMQLQMIPDRLSPCPGYLRARPYDPAAAPDGLPGREGTFNMCSFWLVEALTRAGRTDPARLEDARLLFEQMLGYANHLGLFAEQTGTSGEALGNYPQAFTHLALISAAFNLDRVLGAR